MKSRAWFRVHSWLGVVTGLLMFVICWSGTLATVSREIDWLLDPAQRVQPGTHRASWSEIEHAVRQAYPQASDMGFSAPLYERSAAQVTFSLPWQRSLRVWVDPYTSEVRGARSYFNVQRFFRSFHMNLFSNTWGFYTVVSFGVLLLVSLVAPLVFYKRWWRRFFVLKTGNGSRVFWSDAHKLVGLWGLWFVLVIAITGVWYLFEGLRADIGDGKSAWTATFDAALNRLPPLEVLPNTPSLPLDDLVAKAHAARPDLNLQSIRMDSGYLYADGQSEHWFVRDRANKLYLDPRDGRVVFTQAASDQPAYWRWSDTADPLHFGDFGGLATKLTWFVFGLGLSGLCLTGAWLYAQRLARETGGRERVRWPGMGAAIVVTLLVLAASAKSGWDEVRGYGPMVDGVQRFPEVAWPVAAFIGGWVVLTLAIIGWWVWLLRRPCVPR